MVNNELSEMENEKYMATQKGTNVLDVRQLTKENVEVGIRLD